MRLAMFKPAQEPASEWRLGIASDGQMLDVSAERAAPRDVLDVLRRGEEALRFLRTVQGRCYPLDQCRLDAPLRPGKLITMARNYLEHVAEHGLTHTGKVPSASIKASSSLTGPYDDIVRPAVEQQLDYETELAVVIGRACKNVPPSHAYEVIAGYTVLCDVVARQVLKIERAAGNQFLGKMFDSFGPLGPYLVTKDEVPDPMNLTITTRVNGELRQHSNTGKMIWKIPQLVAYFSQATLQPGDIISTGTPAGVAAGRQPHESPWYLKPGDVIECEVERVGLIRSRIIDDKSGPSSWNWAA